MDPSNPQCATLSNGEKENKTIIHSKRARFFKTYCCQDFSLPDSVMFYVAKNPPSIKLYDKMIQTCKDFFVKNPILIIFRLDYTRDEWCVNQEPFNLDNLTSKFWIIHCFRVKPDNSAKSKEVNEKLIISIIPKIFKCDAKNLTLYDQILSIADLCHLASTAKKISLYNIVVKEKNGTIVGIEKIVEISVKATEIDIHKLPITCVKSKTMKELIKISHFCKLTFFSLSSIPEAFDIKTFSVYMKKNKHTYFILDFDHSISHAYKNRLQKVLNEIIATENFDYKPPNIRFPGISHENVNKLLHIRLNN